MAEEIYQRHRSTLKKTSRDKMHMESMIDDVSVPVYNYDGVVKEYSTREHIPKPCSNDALYIDDSRITFIEFKNGSVKEEQLMKKVYDSVLVLFDSDMGLEWCRPDFIGNISFSRRNIDFILVWENPDADPKNEERIVKLSATPLRNRPHMVFCSQGTFWGASSAHGTSVGCNPPAYP